MSDVPVTCEPFGHGQVGFYLSKGRRRIGLAPDGSGHMDVFLPANAKNKVAIAYYCGSVPVIQGETNEALWERVNPKHVPNGALYSDR